MENKEIKFTVNKEMILLTSLDDEMYIKLLNDNDYVKEKINELITDGTLQINGSLKSIIRFINDDLQETILEDETESQTLTGNEWGTEETKLLLDKYEMYLSNVGPLKKFKTKKNMWKQIAEDLENMLNIKRTETQCENRYKTLMKRKKKAIDNNRTSGSSRQDIPFEDEIRKICSMDDSIEPVVLRGVGDNVIIKEKNTIESESESEETRRKQQKKSVAEVLQDIYKAKEESKERRHREKMEMFNNILQSLSEKKSNN